MAEPKKEAKPADKGAKPAAAGKPGEKPAEKGAKGAEKGGAGKPAAAAPAATTETVPAPPPAPKPQRLGAAVSTPPKKRVNLVHPEEHVPPRTNVMQKLQVAKVTVNIGVGQAGERLEKAEKVLANLTSRKPVRTVSKYSIRDWNIREGMPIGVKVTLRGDEAIQFAKRALWTRNFRVAEWSFDKEGNLLFGVPDHTAFEGQKYNPEIGIFGMDVAITVERPGFRIKRRQHLARRIPRDHRVTRTESKDFLKQTLNLEII